MKLEYIFEYQGKVFTPLQPVNGFTGPLPSQDNLVEFGGSEANALGRVSLPAAYWRVRQLCFVISSGTIEQVTITLEIRSKKAERVLDLDANH